MSTIRQASYQLLRTFALIMLLLFELGMGLFIEAKDIPAAVWAVVVGFGMAYVLSMWVVEWMQRSRTDALRSMIITTGEANNPPNRTRPL